MVLQHADDVGPAAELVVVDVADVGRLELVPPRGGERHLPLLLGRPLGLVQAVEGAVGGQYAPAGPRAKVYADLRQRGVDPEGAEVGVALEAPHGLDGLQAHR